MTASVRVDLWTCKHEPHPPYAFSQAHTAELAACTDAQQTEKKHMLQLLAATSSLLIGSHLERLTTQDTHAKAMQVRLGIKM